MAHQDIGAVYAVITLDIYHLVADGALNGNHLFLHITPHFFQDQRNPSALGSGGPESGGKCIITVFTSLYPRID